MTTQERQKWNELKIGTVVANVEHRAIYLLIDIDYDQYMWFNIHSNEISSGTRLSSTVNDRWEIFEL